MEIVGGPVRRAAVRYTVESITDATCQVAHATVGELRPWLAWLTPLMPAAGRRLIRSNLATLERLLDVAPAAAQASA